MNDPLVALHGSELDRDSAVCKVMWLALGLTLAWRASVVWTSHRVSVQAASVTEKMTEDLAEAVSSETANFLGGRLVTNRCCVSTRAG